MSNKFLTVEGLSKSFNPSKPVFANVDFESAIKSQRLFFKTEIEFRKNLKQLKSY